MMENKESSKLWTPIARPERIATLDAVRGIALLGVLLVNALVGFRVSLFEHLLRFHSHADWVNRLVDVLVAGLIEFKAIALFTLMFGIGIGVQAERAAIRSISVSRFLVRRFLVLLAFGLVHMFLIWNGDILTLYAICGLLIVPLIRLHIVLQVIFGVAIIVLPIKLPFAGLWHVTEPVLRTHAALATRIYSEGSLSDILALRWNEAWQFITPLLIDTLPTTFGLILLGVAVWRAGVVREPGRHQGLLWAILVVGMTVGGVTRSLLVFSRSTGQPVAIPPPFDLVSPDVLLALSYAAGLFLWLRSPRSGPIISSMSAAGQMALSNYLAQSVILSFIFYSYGFGLFGRLGSALVVILCLIIYAGQLVVSRAWLSHYRFGPLEWLWRSLNYRRWQPMRRNE
ncbi:MAG: DUF418 domain-containing protein [Acidobacteria bacterium]|nr:DUF418 domain-containing protein [Acidobacteriota bacterium]